MALDLSRRRSVQAGRVWNKRGEGLPVSLSHRTGRNSRGGSSFTLITLAALPIALPRPQWIVFLHAQTNNTLTPDTGYTRAKYTNVQRDGLMASSANSVKIVKRRTWYTFLVPGVNGALAIFLSDFGDISMTAAHGCHRFIYQTTTAGLRCSDCGGHLRTVNSFLRAINKWGKSLVVSAVILT